jgi:hypothetical protein
MGSDATENARRELVTALNAEPKGRAELELKHGEVWDTDELRRDFEVRGFMPPFVVVRRKSDGIAGSLVFQHRPRFYFRFSPVDEQR